MAKTTIAKAIHTLSELLAGLDKAYWEANSADNKDFFYDIIRAIYAELSELNKLSIQDHDLGYESVTETFGVAQVKLIQLNKYLHELVLHSGTAASLERLIPDALTLTIRE
jgi:NAD-dependent DNA ligase